jgi:hypothetical protein
MGLWNNVFKTPITDDDILRIYRVGRFDKQSPRNWPLLLGF